MALRQAGLIFRAEAAASLVITPRAGEAFRIRRIFLSNLSTALQHLLVVNDTARVGFFRGIGLGGGHLLNPDSLEHASTTRGTNLLDWMAKYAGFLGYPVVQGEALTLSLDTGTADIFAVGDSLDAGDIKGNEQNGSHSSDVLYVNYGTNSAIISATGYNKVDRSRNPQEMMSFPFGAPAAGLVPSGKKAHIYVIGGQPVGRFVGAGATGQTQYLRPRIGSAPAQTIFDRADVGVPFFGTIPGAAGADYTSARSGVPSNPRTAETLDDSLADLDFNGNDEFALQVQTTIVGAGQLNANDVDLWTLQRVTSA